MTLLNSIVTIHMAASLDGYIARKDGSVDWLETADEFPAGETMGPNEMEQFLTSVGCYVMGSRTYETALNFESQGFGWAYGDKPVFVLTTRQLAKTRDTIQFYSGDLRELIDSDLRTRFQTIWIAGGGTVASECLRLGLTDEIRYSVVPILIGDGIRFFGESDVDIACHLHSVRPFKNGIIEICYRLKRD